MGAPFGIPVYAGKEVLSNGFGRYVGKGRMVSEEEWERIKNQFDLEPLRAFEQAQAALGRGHYPAWWNDGQNSGLNSVVGDPDDWEAYVGLWVLKRTNNGSYRVRHPLDEKQVNAAWAVLKSCKAAARPVWERLQRRRRELDDRIAIMRGRSATETTTAPHATAAGDAPAVALAERAALERPDARLAAMFENFKRRLEALLRQEQLVVCVVKSPRPPVPTRPKK